MNRSPLVRIGLLLEKAGNSRILVSLFIALLLVVPAVLLYNSMEGTWANLSQYSKRAETTVFPKPAASPEASAPATGDDVSTDAADAPAAPQSMTQAETAATPPPSADARLLHVIETWDRLPENVRQAVDVLVRPYVEDPPK